MAIHSSIVAWRIPQGQRSLADYSPKSCRVRRDFTHRHSTALRGVQPLSQSYLKMYSSPQKEPLCLLQSLPFSPLIPGNHSLFFSCPQSFPASGSFSMSWLLTSTDRSIGASASALDLPHSKIVETRNS